MAIVSIIGRPNVGKSSLFNRIAGQRLAIVDDLPGVTRDRLYAPITTDRGQFYLVDTGGLEEENSERPFAESVRRQVHLALAESDLVLFVVDGRGGINALDREVAMTLRRSERPVLVVANKIDDPKHDEAYYDVFELGFEEAIPVSAEHNRNISTLLEMIEERLPRQESLDAEDEIRVALVGRPNVGKSSILNELTGSDRSLVSDIPGTTRDVVDSVVVRDDRRFRFVDTAGLRRKSRIDSRLEYYSTVRTFQAIDRSDVVLLVMEGTEVATDQDKRLAGHIVEQGRGLVLVVNKWDLVSKDPSFGPKLLKKIREELSFVDHAPVVFVSALSGRSVGRLPEAICRVQENRCRRIVTSRLNEMLRDILAFERMPGDGKGRYLRISYLAQVSVTPPTFVFFVNDPSLVTVAFERYVIRQLRKMETFEGTPLRLFWRKKRPSAASTA
ncbi:ribosome biogenesis GTPase Der [Aminithiophilus ramosus]|uniref:GTPase Der n=2 Tax=Synergistales TaxID=649776 RepID=A0A9Q7AP07_9BACT|nr:ribosome biogenesis GTPase Der [Aminithiophilus ramosus]QTX32932.1 ribosome biogenesis GTPase Der [Aminithiophilus ramosus]QVL37302.1 ribosome biogenesis GTPase Der [Synergistota bacterium]